MKLKHDAKGPSGFARRGNDAQQRRRSPGSHLLEVSAVTATGSVRALDTSCQAEPRSGVGPHNQYHP